ncbi:UNVERIFIED_CONTAM: Endoplasmic reticulum-Golgi intermediate compartment protein 3 [Sesamum indicum]
MESIIGKLRSLDAYPKINEDFYSRTLSGGVITLASSIVMFLLFFSELSSYFLIHISLSLEIFMPLRLYLNAVTETKLVVDTSRGERLRINFDVTFPALPCSIVSLDAMDISGEQHLDVRHDIIKKRIDAHGNVIETRPDTIGAPKIERPLQRHGGRLEHNETYCGSCYGAEATDDDCCNNCEEVREAYRKKGWALSDPDLIDQCKREGFLQKIKDEEGEGCNVYGFLDVNKVAGNFHFAPGKSFQQSNVHVHDLLAFHKDSFNISHRINRLAFGDYFPGAVNPLDGYFVCAFFFYGLSDVILCSFWPVVCKNGSIIKTSAFVSTCSVQWTQQTPNAMYQYFLKWLHEGHELEIVRDAN